MKYDVAKKYFSNCPLGFRAEFVEFIGICSIKIGSDTICK
jgi:hypothetical protein